MPHVQHRPGPVRSSEAPARSVQRQARSEEGTSSSDRRSERGPTIDDFELALSAPPVQLDAFDAALSDVYRSLEGGGASLQRTAASGLAGQGGELPHRARIEESFGPGHDLSGIEAHTGGAAADACDALGANGYATGNGVAFAESPALELAAHEAAHVVQQRSGAVQLSGGVGQSGDRWEQQADAVAARVVAGQSAADLLPAPGAAAPIGAGGGVQRSVVQLDAAAPVGAVDPDIQKKIEALTLQELKLFNEKIKAKVEEAKRTGQVNPKLAALKDYCDKREIALNAEIHAGATNSTGEQKRHIYAKGSQESIGRSRESGVAQDEHKNQVLQPQQGERVTHNKTTVEGKTQTESSSETRRGKDGGPNEAVASSQSTAKNESNKTTVKHEASEITRGKDGSTETVTKSSEQNTKGNTKNATTTTTLSGDGQKATVTEKTSESARDRNDAAKEAEKAADDKRKKVGLPPKTDVKVKLVALEVEGKLGQDRKKPLGSADLGKGVKASAERELATAEAKAAGDLAWDPAKGLTVTGSASAKATLVGGAGKLEMGPYPIEFAGESLRISMNAGISAAILAEAQGSIAVNLARDSNKVGIKLDTPKTNSAGGAAKLSAFVGGKAGFEIGAKLEWLKKPTYRVELKQWIQTMMAKYLPESVAKRLPESFAETAARVIIGSGGAATMAAIKAGVEGTAGIGGEASGNFSLAGGRIRMSGNLQGTVGLGVGSKVSLDVDAIEGIRFLGLAVMNSGGGAASLLQAFGTNPEQVLERLKAKVDEFKRWLGKEIYEIGTGARGKALDYVIPDKVAKSAAAALGYSPGE